MNKQKQQAQQEYQKLVKEVVPASEIPMSCLRAFIVGGAICTLGQALTELSSSFFQLTNDQAQGLTTLLLVFIGSLLTGLGVYDRLGKFAGAGSIVPITGFANSIVAPAMEYKREGLVLGVAAKMFQLAGPVLVYGTVSSVFVGIIYFALRRWLL